jgi:hypothetical protein
LATCGARSGSDRIRSDSLPSPEADDRALALIRRGDLNAAFWTIQLARALPGCRQAGYLEGSFALREVAESLPAGAAFITMIAAGSGGAALAIKSGSPEPHVLLIPDWSLAALNGLLSECLDADGSRDSLNAGYQRFKRSLGAQLALRTQAWQSWDKLLERVLAGLGALGWGRLLEWLRDDLAIAPGSEIVLSIPSQLSMIPIGAIPDPVNERCLLDDYAPRLIPNAQLLVQCSQAARRAEQAAPSVLTVLDPTEDLLPDPRSLAKAWEQPVGNRTLLLGRRATVARTVAGLPRSTHYIHYGHGRCHQNRGILQMAGSPGAKNGCRELSDVQVRKLRLERNRLCVLAACESGRLGARQAANARPGLAQSFLMAGSACVIASLWSVESESTLHLVDAVMKHHLGAQSCQGALSPAQALRLAQLELRSGLRCAKQQKVDGGVTGGRLLHLRPGSSLPEAAPHDWRHLYYWAGFCCFGS